MGELKSIQIGEDIIDFEQLKNNTLTQALNLSWQLQPRNIMDVLGTTDVKQTFLKLQELAVTGDFAKLRLGDYIEVPNLHTYGAVKLEIVAFNHYLGRGAPTIVKPHITFMSEDILEIKRMDPHNENRYYYNRELALYLNSTVATALTASIGITPMPVTLQWDWHVSHIATLSVYIPQLEEVMSPGANWGLFGEYGTPTLSSQFPLFALAPYKIHKKYRGTVITWWTATPNRDRTFAFSVVPADGVDAGGGGATFASFASLSQGVTLTFNL